MNQLEQLILSTLVYYDIFDYPLTLVEIHRLLLRVKIQESGEIQDYDLCGIKDTLSSRGLRSSIRTRQGFFFLKGRDRIVKTRLTRYVLAKKKYDKAQKIVRILSHVPFTRAILACNSIAYNNTKEISDIDLVIITKRGGVWWARLFSLLLLSAFHLRPGQGGNKNKICLSVFIDEDNLNLSDLKMSPSDIDFVNWVANFYPLYDSHFVGGLAGGYYRKFWQENNVWLKKYLPHAEGVIQHTTRQIRHTSFAKIIFEYILLPFTFLARNVQQQYFPHAIRELANQDTRVRVEEGLLKFHVNDRRLQHLEEFVKRYENAIKATSS